MPASSGIKRLLSEMSDVVILPGGFSYGDYLRCGAIARFSPVMKDVVRFAGSGGLVIGICNGFQVLTEAGLLPGVLLRNKSLLFICKYLHLRVENADTKFTNKCLPGDVLEIPIAHGEGNYFIDPEISFADFRSRTPGPPFSSMNSRRCFRRTRRPPRFSSINSTPAFSRALRMAVALATVIAVIPSTNSARWIVAKLTPDSRTRSEPSGGGSNRRRSAADAAISFPRTRQSGALASPAEQRRLDRSSSIAGRGAPERAIAQHRYESG